MPKPKNKEEYRAELANNFAHVLEEHGLSWRKNWRGTGGLAQYNAVTKACYRGTNAFSLSLTAMVKGYSDPRWVTMVQIMDTNGKYHPGQKWHLKAGSKATYVEYWYHYDIKNKKTLTWEQYEDELDGGRKESEFSLLTRYTAVFNASMVEGMPEYIPAQKAEISPDTLIETLSTKMGVKIAYDGGDRAYYSTFDDSIHLPAPESFDDSYSLNSTALHELAHSTGYFSRLNRDMSGFFGSSSYAYEELVAEISSCFMGANVISEIPSFHIQNHKAYVKSWIRKIQEKPETLVRAIKDAQAAANYMDWKAGLLSEKEYTQSVNSVIEVKVKSKDLVR